MAWPTTRRLPYAGREPRPYSRIAPHIRGRVFSIGRRSSLGDLVWYMEVINTNTGEVVASDNTAHYEKMADLCDEVAGAARAAWFWSFRKGELR